MQSAPIKLKSQPPRMTRQEQQLRIQEKRKRLLGFLASGEVYTSVQIAAQLLDVSRPAAVKTLVAMERDQALKSEVHRIDGHALRIYGITPHGLACADAFDSPFFELGRTNSNWIPHRLDTQRMRLKAEALGWRDWMGERSLLKLGLKKVPDASARNLGNELVAIEIERHCKTPKRYQQLIVAYLQEIKSGRFHHVDFVCPSGIELLVKRAMEKVTNVKFAGMDVAVTESHRARFHFYSFDNWPEVNRGN